MSGIIISTPPTLEVPPGNNAANPSSLPGITYQYAILSLPQTWTAKQTFPLGNISLYAADVIGVSSLPSYTTSSISVLDSTGLLPYTLRNNGGSFSLLNTAGTLEFLNVSQTGDMVVASSVTTGALNGSVANVATFNFTTANAVGSASTSIATQGKIFSGSAAHPLTTATPQVGISRYEAINTDTQGGQNPALYVESVGNNTSNTGSGIIAQTVGLTSVATQLGFGDVVGVYGVAFQSGATTGRYGYGGFFHALAATGQNAFGIEVATSNNSGTDRTYVSGNTPSMAGAHLNAAGSKLSEVGLYLDVGGTGTAQWDVGVAFRAGSVKTATIQDDSSAVTSFKMSGTHTNGLDTSGGTYSGKQILGTGYSISPTGAGTFTVVNATTGFQISGAAATGNVLRGNGTNFISAQLAASDLGGLATGVSTWLGTPTSANLRAALTDETGTGAAYFQGGDLGTPSAGVLTSATGLPISTGVSGLAANVATFLTTPSSANLRAALTDEVGTGAAYFVGGALSTPASATLTNATGLPISTGLTGAGTGVLTALGVNVGTAGSPVLNGGVLGTPSSGTATNLTGLPLTTGVTGTLPVANGGTNYTGGAWTAFTCTITAASGAITTQSSASTYLQIGKMVFIKAQATVSNIGTGSGTISFSLPVAAAGPGGGFIPGRENAVSGKMQAGIITGAGATTANILNFDNSAPTFSNGVSFNFSGSYEAQ